MFKRALPPRSCSFLNATANSVARSKREHFRFLAGCPNHRSAAAGPAASSTAHVVRVRRFSQPLFKRALLFLRDPEQGSSMHTHTVMVATWGPASSGLSAACLAATSGISRHLRAERCSSESCVLLRDLARTAQAPAVLRSSSQAHEHVIQEMFHGVQASLAFFTRSCSDCT